MMKKVLSVLLAVTLFACSLHLDELVRLPALIHHYTEYLGSDSKGSIGDFLYKHYISFSNTGKSEDSGKHTKLPFKSAKSLISHFGLFTSEIILDVHTSFIIVILAFPVTGVKSSSGFSAIWQPPKIN